MGEVFIEEKGEGPLERDILGIQVDTAARVMLLGVGGQILLTRSVFDNARTIPRGEALEGLAALSWASHGLYSVKAIEEPFEICEVGEEGRAAFQPPSESKDVRQYVAPDREPILGWRPAVEQVVPGTEWQLEEKLGESGFAEVWRAHHRRANASLSTDPLRKYIVRIPSKAATSQQALRIRTVSDEAHCEKSFKRMLWQER